MTLAGAGPLKVRLIRILAPQSLQHALTLAVNTAAARLSASMVTEVEDENFIGKVGDSTSASLIKSLRQSPLTISPAATVYQTPRWQASQCHLP